MGDAPRFLPGQTIWDQATEPEALARIDPKFADAINNAKNIRDILAPTIPVNAVLPGDKNLKWVASVPKEVWETAVHVNPELEYDKVAFYKWLRKHPAYATYDVNKRRG